MEKIKLKLQCEKDDFNTKEFNPDTEKCETKEDSFKTQITSLTSLTDDNSSESEKILLKKPINNVNINNPLNKIRMKYLDFLNKKLNYF